jgi:hypothetical protein
MTIKNEGKVGRSRVRRHNYIDPLSDSLLLELTMLELCKLRVIDPTTDRTIPHKRSGFSAARSGAAEDLTRLSDQFIESQAGRAYTVHGWFR